MAAEVIYHPISNKTRAFVHADALSAFSLLAMKQPRTNRLAAWMLDEDAPFGEQPPAKRIQVILCSVHKVQVQFTKQTKPVNNIVAVIARLALQNGYPLIARITSASHGQSHGGRTSHSGRRNNGDTGQNAPGFSVPSGAGNGGGGPSKRSTKRGGGGDGEGNPSKKKKLSDEPQGPETHPCIVYQLLTEGKDKHPCKDKLFTTLESAVDHHLRIHVGHIQCPTCLIRKGTSTDMGKHLRTAGCTPPAKIREEIVAHGDSVRRVKSWDDLKEQVAPNGKIKYDMASDIDNLARQPVGEDRDFFEQLMAPLVPGQTPFPDILGLEGIPLDHTPQASENPYGYPPWSHGGIGHDLNTLTTGTISPQRLVKSVPDSGYSPSTKPDFEVYQHSQVLNQTSSGGVGWLMSGNEAPEQDSISTLLKRVNWVIETFQEYDKDPASHTVAQSCARTIALGLPESILKVFAETYQGKVRPKRETQVLGAAKSKEEERE
ncbi:unnamed protein product [Tuber aestivum]|uniref:Uncharacterized protein n=1 Tax=Tuber aestivum TaxID=59557 RepID=A0A292PRH4_9PEZI|nr:unnamed protein product [Tuber aestivum]